MRPPQPQLEPVPETDLYLLTEDWSVNYDGKRVTVPSGFCYNGASIPWIAEPITYGRFSPKVVGPALPHDFGYATKFDTRKEIDRLFHAHLRANGCSPRKAWMMWAAVRLFGWFAWIFGDDQRGVPEPVDPDTTTPLD